MRLLSVYRSAKPDLPADSASNAYSHSPAVLTALSPSGGDRWREGQALWRGAWERSRLHVNRCARSAFSSSRGRRFQRAPPSLRGPSKTGGRTCRRRRRKRAAGRLCAKIPRSHFILNHALLSGPGTLALESAVCTDNLRRLSHQNNSKRTVMCSF